VIFKHEVDPLSLTLSAQDFRTSFFFFICLLASKVRASGIKPKAENASEDKMSVVSRNPSRDLSNQEKNQY